MDTHTVHIWPRSWISLHDVYINQQHSSSTESSNRVNPGHGVDTHVAIHMLPYKEYHMVAMTKLEFPVLRPPIPGVCRPI